MLHGQAPTLSRPVTLIRQPGDSGWLLMMQSRGEPTTILQTPTCRDGQHQQSMPLGRKPHILQSIPQGRNLLAVPSVGVLEARGAVIYSATSCIEIA